MADQTLADTDFIQQLQEFVRDKWSNNPCHRCGNFSWAVLPGNATVLHLTAQSPESQDLRSASAHGVEFIPIYCDNCGNTVTIYKQVFDEWRKARSRTT